MKYYISSGEENHNGLQEVLQATNPIEAAVLALSRQNYDNKSLNDFIYVNERGFPNVKMELGESPFPTDGLFLPLSQIWALTFPGIELE